MRILIVEKDLLVRQTLCQVLRQAGIFTITAISGNAVGPYLEVGDFNLLLTSFAISGRLTGLDLADAAAVKGIRSIIMSDDAADRRTVEASGIRFVAKPIAVRALLSAIAAESRAGAPCWPPPWPIPVNG